MARINRWTWAAMLPLAAAAAGPAGKAGAPTSQPATQPTGQALSVGQGLVEFNAPSDEWTVHAADHPNQDIVILIHGDGSDGEMKVMLQGKEYHLSKDTDGQMAVKMAQMLKDLRRRQKQEMLTPPTVVKENRFDIAIHERFRVKDDVVEDEMHLFKSVGPRTVEVTVATVSTDADVVKHTFDDGEAVLAAAKYNRKAFKK